MLLDEDDEMLAQNKPLAVYLPGLDGFGISAAQYQFDDLAKTFEFWRLTIAPEDRSALEKVVTLVADFVLDMSQRGQRPVTLIGESCGGLIAAAVALQIRQRERSSIKQKNNSQLSALKGLVLVNPATSFDRTNWEVFVPILTSLVYFDRSDPQDPDRLTLYGVLGSLILSSLVPDNNQKLRIFDAISNLPALDIPPRNTEQVEAILDATRRGFQETEFRLPAELLQHRVEEWLTVGAPVVSKRLSEIDVPTLVVAGRKDALMPSEDEAKRLVDTIPYAKSLLVPDRGHFVLDESCNLTEAILYSDIDPLDWKTSKKKYDPILDWVLPDPDIINETIERTVKPFITAHSPVFFSTDPITLKRWRGLGKIPEKTGPLLIVGNHQLFAADLRMIFYELMVEKGILARGMAHPVLFAMSNVTDLQGRTPGLSPQVGVLNADYQKFGAVPVTPRNFYRMLQSNQTALLFPGGAKEALKADPDYPLYWPDKVDFVRVAAKLNATVIPLSAIGVVESVNVVVEDVYQLPFIGARARNLSSSLSNARYDKQDNANDLLPSVVVPGVPARNYFLFGPAQDLTNLDPNDRQACEKIYQRIQSDVRTGLDDLMAARTKDPFASTPQRLAYERIFRKTAPTFSIDELNKRDNTRTKYVSVGVGNSRRQVLTAAIAGGFSVAASPQSTPALTANQASVDYDTYAASYDQLDGGVAASTLGLDAARRALVQQATGHALEIGAGTGLNLPYYDWENIRSLTLVDISPGMLRQCKSRFQALADQAVASGSTKLPPVFFITADATQDLLPRFGTNSFDTVVDTFSLCVMGSTGAIRCLDQLQHVSKHRLLLLENTRSAENRWLAAYQDLTASPVAVLGGKGCIYNQDVASMIRRMPTAKIVEEQSFVNGVFTAFVVEKTSAA
jgi:pimeloyl-ACP methyl ester carboxylesterase/SAM-dependent methyltransferase